MSAPLVSVLMAVRNGVEHLPSTMASLLSQTFTEFELVIVDDASEAPTRAELARWAARDGRIRVLRNETGAGLPRALNRGLDRCRSHIVARADGDDIHDPQRLARQYAFLLENRRTGVLSCGYHRIDGEGRRIDTKRAATGPDRIRFRMLFMNSLLHPGVMFRADLVRSVGGYDERYWTAQDSDLWARLLPVTDLDNIDEPLVSYRVHSGSMVRTRGDAGRKLSLTVPARLQSAYLGRTVSEDEARAVVETFQSFAPLRCACVRRGERGLEEILRRSAGRESGEVRSGFRREVADALARQARWNLRREPAAAAALAAVSATWRFRSAEGTATIPRRFRERPRDDRQ